MSFNFPIACLALAFVAFGLGCSRSELPKESAPATTAVASDSHDSHDEHAAHTAAPILEPGQLWATDEPLRTAMQRIRAAVDRAASAQQSKQFTSTEAQALAATIDESITYMITHCKLEPKPDAALHVLIGRMSNAAASVKKDPASDAGVPQLRAALHDYQSTFDHPRG